MFHRLFRAPAAFRRVMTLAIAFAAGVFCGCASRGAGVFGPGEDDPTHAVERLSEVTSEYDLPGGKWIDVDAPTGDVTLGRSRDEKARVTARVTGFGPDDLSARRLAHAVKVRDWFDEEGVLRLAAAMPEGEAAEDLEVDDRGRVFVNHSRVARADFVIAVPRDVNVRVRRSLLFSSSALVGRIEAACRGGAVIVGHEGPVRVTCELGGVRIERASGDVTAEGCGRIEVKESSGAKVLRCSPGTALILGGDGKVEVEASGDVQIVSHLPATESHHIVSERGSVRLLVSPESCMAIHAFSADQSVVFGPDLLPLARVVSNTAARSDDGIGGRMNNVDAFLGAGSFAPVDIRARGEITVDLYRN